MGIPMAPRKKPTVTPKKPASLKRSIRPNRSILNFFQKTERPEESLFVGEGSPSKQPKQNGEAGEDETRPDGVFGEEAVDDKYNERGLPVKKRRLSKTEDGHKALAESSVDGAQKATKLERTRQEEVVAATSSRRPKGKGPFLDDSESESEAEAEPLSPDPSPPPGKVANPIPFETEEEEPKTLEKETSCPPPLLNEDDSFDNTFANADEFADLDDMAGDDEYGGEEYRMMRFMEEQAKIEAEAMAQIGSEPDDQMGLNNSKDATVTNCPICDGSLANLAPDEATRHVNACLDGEPLPLPIPKEEDLQSACPVNVEAMELGKRFARTAIPRPGQANPFQLNGGDAEGKPTTSAFTQLMSGHAESAAWANAAASENASRGKPAYQRTCPFYKIMPGFSICVDAFSDHYIGLTANWIHGPIYCSKVTADLAKMQLRVAAKWLVPLEFEETVEIPGTGGASVTMIPANHCPGSSMFLFEKAIGKGPGPKRKQRILHCGDFRACPGHTTHPLLKPDVRDAITGASKQQKIDICYLDTTYLNPRYSFPPQDNVIRSCAEMCASISPDPTSKNDDIWDRMSKKDRTASVGKFFTASSKQEESPAKADAGVSAPRGGSNHQQSTLKIRAGPPAPRQQRLLVICGTYSIGKERICIAIAQALKTKIFASPAKIRICSKLGDPELTALLTSDPLEAQVHMQMLMEIRAETLRDYLDSYRPHFSRIVGFRPSGWNYRPAGGSSASTGANTSPSSVPTAQILHSQTWRSQFSIRDMVPQRGSTREAMCFGVPYSEHSSFRELAMFIMSLRIERVVPTVNVGSEVSRKRMKGWVDRWMADRKRGGIVTALVEGEVEAGEEHHQLWDGKNGKGGGAWW